jgi:hypothetical protein
MKNNLRSTFAIRVVAAKVAAKDIIEEGIDRYVNDGIRFGFFSVDDDPKQIITNVIDRLIEYEEYELAGALEKYKTLNV